MRRVWPVALMVGVALWLTARPVAAQVVVASVRSTDAVLESVAYFATLFGREDIAKQLESFIDTLTGNKGLVGLDRRNPVVFYVPTVPAPGQQTTAVIALPLSDEKDFLQLLLALNFQVQEPDANQVRAITLPTGQSAYLRFAHRYAFICNDRSHLAGKLADPAQLLKPEQKQHHLTVSLRIGEIPPAVRKQLYALLRAVADKPIERKPNETQAQYQLRQQLTQLVREVLLQAIEDLEEVMAVADLHTKTNQLTVDLDLVFRRGSNTAALVSRLQQTASRFRVLQSGSGSSLVLSYPVYGALRQQMDKLAAMLEKGIAEKPQDQQAILRQLYEAIAPTLKADLHELAVVVHGPSKDGKLTPIIAIRLREGRKLEAALRQLVKVLPEDARSRVHLDSAKVAGHNVHELEISPDDPNFSRVFGEEKLALLVTDDYLLLSAGTHRAATLQQAVATLSVEKAAAVGSVELSLRQFAELIRHNPDSQNFARAILETFSGPSAQQDRIRLVLEGKDNRLHIHLELPTLLARAIYISSRQ